MIEYRIDGARRLVETTLSGTLTYEALRDHQEQVWADPAFDPLFSRVIDCRGADLSILSIDALKTMASATLAVPDRRIAFVHRDDANQGVLRLYATYLGLLKDKGEVALFLDRQSAIDWATARPATGD